MLDRDRLFAICPILKLEDHPLLAILGCLYNTVTCMSDYRRDLDW
jgi:hypothetical protein